ncbi:MAG: toll/interleukin-1 receptor domain-containing protein [Lachnospiraceae bacterium]|nr:toll/interleukin-1 receptor domain-containing protein [Lachnospiraceae bacterium]
MVFKCKMCDATLKFNPGDSVTECEYCGTMQSLPKYDDERIGNLYNRAEHYRKNNEFDKAQALYEEIVNEHPQDADAYWSVVLCKYGVEYVEEPGTNKRVPTVNRTQYTSVFDDENYKEALKYADEKQRSVYEEEAKEINEIQKGILEISKKEEPFDIFICYKETDENGRRTLDSVLASELYEILQKEGYKVFYARVTLDDKFGVAYEPYIFAALQSSKVMIAVGTKPEHFEAVWVKNEWSRYLALIKNGAKKTLIPAYKDMDPYNMPMEFAHLQAINMGELGFQQDMISGIRKLMAEGDSAVGAAAVTASINVAAVLERGFLYAEDKNWEDANACFEKVLNVAPQNAEAYLGKLLVDLQVTTKDGLLTCGQLFDQNANYKKIIRFGDTEIKAFIERAADEGGAGAREQLYKDAVWKMENSIMPEPLRECQKVFESLGDYMDSKDKLEECKQRVKDAEEKKLEDLYRFNRDLMNQNDIDMCKRARNFFQDNAGYKDCSTLAAQCKTKIDRLENEKQREEDAILKNAHRLADQNAYGAKSFRKQRNKTMQWIELGVSAIFLLIICIVYLLESCS